MSRYSVEFTTATARQIRKLPSPLRTRVLVATEKLADGPRPAGAKKLVGEDSAWRIRVGDYRILYDITDEVLTITVVRAAHRRDVHR